MTIVLLTGKTAGSLPVSSKLIFIIGLKNIPDSLQKAPKVFQKWLNKIHPLCKERQLELKKKGLNLVLKEDRKSIQPEALSRLLCHSFRGVQ